MDDVFSQFVTLWVVVDPIGTVPVFVTVAASFDGAARAKLALAASAIAAGVLLFFLVFGQLLIDALEIGLPSFQIAGGIVLFLFALTMIFGPSKPEEETEKAERSPQGDSPAVFPLAVPSLASPGAMLAIVLLTDNNRFSVPEQAMTAAIMLVVVGIAFLLMLAAGTILKFIGIGGVAIVSRVMGMILAAVAVENIIAAVIQLLRTTTL